VAGLAEEGAFVGAVTELMAQDAERTRGVAETGGDLVGGELFDEIGAEGFVLAVEGVLGGEEEGRRVC
jgi:hypothetical protein